VKPNNAASRANIAPGAPASVSVVIPCYRCAKTIRRAVASVARQTVPVTEIILVDDASGDETIDTLRALQREYGETWVKLVELMENVGPGGARNEGWNRASGEFVAFLDADDAWHPAKIEVQYRFMSAHPDIALCGHGHQRVKEMPLDPTRPDSEGYRLISYRALLLSNRFITPSAMVRREIPQRFARGKRHMEDLLLWLTIAASGARIARLDAELAFIFKAPFGESGLSAEIMEMERGELGTYRALHRSGHLGAFATVALSGYSITKFLRRLLIAALLGHRGSLPWIFPLTYLTVSLSTTALFVVVGLLGNSTLAAEIAVVHGATVATFHALSANTRQLILGQSSAVTLTDILRLRIALVGPLAGIALLLATLGTGVPLWLAGFLVIRRCAEWFNDVQLCRAEVNHDTGFAGRFLILQAVLFTVAAAALALGWGYAPLAVGLWAVAPLLVALPLHRAVERGHKRPIRQALPSLLTHAGSTAVTGLALYAFRLIVILVLSKALAGDLFVAIAIGSFAGTLFANVLGPSVELQQSRKGLPFPRAISVALAAQLLVGVSLTLGTLGAPSGMVVVGKGAFFWLACGLSLIGGVVMVFAQQIRLRVMRGDDARDVFGPDVLIHLGLLGATPLLIAVAGAKSATGLYLLNAALAYVFYRSSAAGQAREIARDPPALDRLKAVLASLIVLPVFFELAGRIYNSPEPIADSGGVLAKLPLPVSTLASGAGIVLLAAYRNTTRSFTFVFFFFATMLLSTVVTNASGLATDWGKLLLLMQFLLPTFALVLGEMFESRTAEDRLIPEHAFFLVCALVMPAQLLASWIQGQVTLTHSLWLFSIYQHWQYVPVVLACATLIAVFALLRTPSYRPWCLALSVVSFAYASSAVSLLAIFFSGLGVAMVVVPYLRRLTLRTTWVVVATLFIPVGGLIYVLEQTPEFHSKIIPFGTLRDEWRLPCTDDPAKYVSRLVTSSKDGCLAHGTPSPPRGYLIALRRLYVEEGDSLHVEGEVRTGGVSVGLVSSGSWAILHNIDQLGPFDVTLTPPPGRYAAVVANYVDAGKLNAVTIRRMEWRLVPRADAQRDANQLSAPAWMSRVLPLNLVERIEDWMLFGRPIFDSIGSFLFGHAKPMDRRIRTSAHNFYIDLVYNFGILALGPFLVLIAHTFRELWLRRHDLSGLHALALVVLFLVIVDASFKVTLRQPYPGIFTFFLWGLLLARVRTRASVPRERRVQVTGDTAHGGT